MAAAKPVSLWLAIIGCFALHNAHQLEQPIARHGKKLCGVMLLSDTIHT